MFKFERNHSYIHYNSYRVVINTAIYTRTTTCVQLAYYIRLGLRNRILIIFVYYGNHERFTEFYR
jgi:hypothetical protein